MRTIHFFLFFFHMKAKKQKSSNIEQTQMKVEMCSETGRHSKEGFIGPW